MTQITIAGKRQRDILRHLRHRAEYNLNPLEGMRCIHPADKKDRSPLLMKERGLK